LWRKDGVRTLAEDVELRKMWGGEKVKERGDGGG